MTQIVLADDHKIVRQGLRTILEAEHDFSILGEASDGLETVKMVEDLKPDVLVVDIMMPNLNGLEVTREISNKSNKTKVIILSMYDNESYILEALRNGALGYVLKSSESIYLCQAIREAVAGRRYLSPPLSDSAIKSYIEKTKESIVDVYETLTSRERQVFQLVAEGNTNSQIADRLYISSRTVEIHRSNMMRKLGLHKYAEIVKYAVKKGLLDSNKDPLNDEKK